MTTPQALAIVDKLWEKWGEADLQLTSPEDFFNRYEKVTELINSMESKPGPIGRSISLAVADGYASYMVVDVQEDLLRKEKAARLVRIPGIDNYYLPSVGSDGWYPLSLIQATWAFEDCFAE